MLRRSVLGAAVAGLLASVAAAQPPGDTQPQAGYAPLVDAIEQAALIGEPAGYLSLLSPTADLDAARAFANEHLRRDADRVTVTPRFRAPLDDHPEGTAYELTLELFTEVGPRGRLETWQLDIRLEAGDVGWRIHDQWLVDALDNLWHLTLTPTTQLDADNMVILGQDLSLTLTEGSVFVAETDRGVTGLVLLGEGLISFSPQPEAEQGQIRIFSGDETLEGEFEAAFVRIHPDVFRSRVSTSGLVERAVDPEAFREATAFFDEFIPLSFTLDLSELSDRIWSLSPGVGDFVAEVRTKRHGDLTYTQSAHQPEDVSLFERETNHMISLYSSARKRATQGRYFGEDDGARLDVLDYDISASFEPLGVTQEALRMTPELVGCRITGVARLAVRVKGLPIGGFSLRLADELVVSSVTSADFGPLLFFRLSGQNNLVVNLPTEVPGGTEFTFTVRYSGELAGQELDENWIANQYVFFEAQGLFGVGEPRYLYSNRSYWYPQGLTTDYATATLNLSVPGGWGVVASGDPLGTNPPVADNPGDEEERRFSFVTVQPARYLSTLISRFDDHAVPVRQVRLTELAPPPPTTRTDGAVFYDTLSINAHGSPRSGREIDGIAEQAADIASFYGSLLGDIPYPSMTVAVTDDRLPGGHSPAYFTMLNHELPRAPGVIISWKTDPVSFSGFPEFFLAHEIAHQWWGQAVGWKNYHEQWLSEGLAQYFAALYAEHAEGEDRFLDILRQMRRWAMRHSAEGPVYLGYRLGHLDGEPRIFRALVYNKGAMVLHMLRGLIGDEAFFAGLRRFYHEWRFQKAGTDGLELAFEIEAGRSLSRFFDRWIHESALPELRFSSSAETVAGGDEVVLRFEQQTERLFDLPVAVRLEFRSGAEETVIVEVADRVTEVRVPARDGVRRVRVNPDEMALAEIDR